jgi:hypothetical protein
MANIVPVTKIITEENKIQKLNPNKNALLGKVLYDYRCKLIP